MYLLNIYFKTLKLLHNTLFLHPEMSGLPERNPVKIRNPKKDAWWGVMALVFSIIAKLELGMCVKLLYRPPRTLFDVLVRVGPSSAKRDQNFHILQCFRTGNIFGNFWCFLAILSLKNHHYGHFYLKNKFTKLVILVAKKVKNQRSVFISKCRKLTIL